MLLDPDCAPRILRILAATGLAPRHLTLEILEHQPFRYGNRVVRTNLRLLCDAGVKLALDDIGPDWAGLKSWSKVWIRVSRLIRHVFLRRLGFHFTTLKLDRSLISRLDEPEVEAIIREVITLANQNGITEIVAEGVETDDQMHRAVRLGCLIQGWRLKRKLPPDELEQWLSTQLGPLERLPPQE
jgi:EAL domain-containing protein (putative c-di-GMP-specific phosphodiesterase class I)